MIDRIGIKTGIEIEIVTGGIGRVVESVGSGRDPAPKIAEIERGVARQKKVAVPEEGNHPCIGMCRPLVSNILPLFR